ncbi:CLIP-associating protein 1-B [Brachyhypopomus gauderio]|uniref:CLIP-associating protein 1-B n=1 Tax=Brachyhypopomus gauderio TaxID=698409 RepID=UPI0040430535
METSMEYIVEQVMQKDLGRRLQVGQEVIDYILDRQRSQDLEHDQTMLDRMVDSLASSWVNSSNFKVALLGMDIISALVTRLQNRFKTQIGTVLSSLTDRLGDAKDQVRDQAQTLLLKIMDQAATPQYVWDRMLGGFKHKNNRTREAVCFCLISTLNIYGAQGLTLSKIVPHICNLLGDPTSQVRDGAMNCLVEIYRHVGERVRMDLGKKGLPQSRLNVIFSRFDEVQRAGNMILPPAALEGGGAVCRAGCCGGSRSVVAERLLLLRTGPSPLILAPRSGSEEPSTSVPLSHDLCCVQRCHLSRTGPASDQELEQDRSKLVSGSLPNVLICWDPSVMRRGTYSSCLLFFLTNFLNWGVCSQLSGSMHLQSSVFYPDKNIDDDDSVDGGRSSASSKGAGTVRRTGSMRRPSSASSTKSTGKESTGAGAVDEEDFIRAFEDVPSIQIYSSRELEDSMTKIREVLADDKQDWEKRVTALKKVRSLLLAGAGEHETFNQHLRQMEAAFKLSAKDLRSQVVREACITLGHLSSVLGNKFDHGAESIMPTLLNLVPNSAKVMATSGIAAIRLIIRNTHYPRLIPIMTSNCTSKSVAVRRRCYEFLDLLLQEWQTSSLERHVAVLMETIRKGLHDADSEARSVARKCYWGFHGHFSKEAEQLFQALELTYQKALQSHLKSSDSIMSLPQSDRSSSSSQESLNRPLSAKTPVGSGVTRTKVVSARVSSTPGGLQRSRSDVDVNAAVSAATSAKSRMPAVPAAAPFSTAAALPPGSYASLGRVRTRRQSSGSGVGGGVSMTDSRGRSRAKVVSQSQRSRSANPAGGKTHAGSRSSSPGKLIGQSYGKVSRATGVVTPSEKRSKIPRSQGCSRETSPSRMGQVRGSRIPRPSMSQGCSRDTSRESSRDTSPARGFTPLDRFGLIHQARISASVNAMRILNTGMEVEAAVADALLLGDSRNKRRPVRRRYESPGMYSDDDANSDASSACSERSYSSRNGAVPHYMRQTEDVAEVLNHCASSNWSERKEGLLGLQNLLTSQRNLSRVELKRLCEIFTRMFADPHSKVFSMFLETLVDFITLHREELQDWLFVLLTQLLKKMGADLLGSVQAKVQKALDITRDSFPYDQQFNILMRFIVDQTQTPNLKVKVAILKYIESLARQMDPSDFVNSSETRLAVSRIITWTTEPKSSDVRKAAQTVLISLFELNTPEFTMLLGALPKTFQDGATKLLHHHLKNSSNTCATGSPSNTVGRAPPRLPSNRTSPLTSPTNCSYGGVSPSMLEFDTENLNSEEIYSSLRGVTEAIQNFSFRSQEDAYEPIKRDGKKDDACGVTSSAAEPRVAADALEGGRTALDNKTSLLNTPSPRPFLGPRARDYNPYNYADSISAYDKAVLREAAIDGDVEQSRDGRRQDFGENKIMHPKSYSAGPTQHVELVGDLLKELSNHSERVDERRSALLELLKVTRDDSVAVWEEHFKTMLLLLLETLGDKDHTIRALALRVLKEILRSQPSRFKNYAELTIMKTLEAHRDSHKEVVRAAEETASTLASSIHPEQCIKVLCPIVQTADYPIDLAAIKMQTKVIERIPQESLRQLMPDIIPGLLQGYDNTESSVRKASVFCLVAIYSVIGEDLKPHLAQLTGSKMKLLNLYIKRAQTTNSNSSSSSDISSHS